MIEFSYECDYQLVKERPVAEWVDEIITSEEGMAGQIDYIFCDDAYLLKINQEYLEHDTYTDIITFDYSVGNIISGDVFVSIERVTENALEFEVSFENELLRVMAHGILHLLGFGDKTREEAIVMRKKEEEKIKLFHVEQY